MSREKGELRICDRCGKEVFCKHEKVIERDGGFTRIDCYDEPEGWGRHLNRDLCPECYACWKKIEQKFKTAEENFFKGGVV